MSLTIEKINKIFRVDESFHASYKLAETLTDEHKRNQIFEEFLCEDEDLSHDWFTEYYQSEHSDRKGKKQDFTPDGIIRIASDILGNTNSNADICAGTGGLTIKRWAENKHATFYCEELSDRAMPFLLFNLAIRNMDAIVCHGDSLTREVKRIYRLTPSDKFSCISELDKSPIFKIETAIMNPPYSLPWSADSNFINDKRFADFEVLAPKSKADFAFLLHGLHFLKDDGVMTIILPHGVLFRGAAEEKIRKKLIEMNYLDAVIGLPEKTFYNTDIPTVILVLKKNRAEKTILFVDASKEFTKNGKQNVIEQRHINKILDVYHNRKELDRFSHIATLEEIKENDFNLNIPRYVDTYEPEPTVSLEMIMKEMIEIDKQIEQSSKELSKMLYELRGTTPEADAEIKKFTAYFSGRVSQNKRTRKSLDGSRGEQLSLL